MSQIRSDVDAQFNIVKALGPVSIATDTNTESSAIDLSAYPGWKVLLVVSSGTRTDGSYTASIRQSDTSGGSYAELAPRSGALTAIGAADTTRKASYVPTKPFIKVRIASTSTTSGALLTAFVFVIPPGN